MPSIIVSPQKDIPTFDLLSRNTFCALSLKVYVVRSTRYLRIPSSAGNSTGALVLVLVNLLSAAIIIPSGTNIQHITDIDFPPR